MKSENADDRLLKAINELKGGASREGVTAGVRALVEHGGEFLSTAILDDVKAAILSEYSRKRQEERVLALIGRHIEEMIAELTDPSSPPWEMLGESVFEEAKRNSPHVSDEVLDSAVKTSLKVWTDRIRDTLALRHVFRENV